MWAVVALEHTRGKEEGSRLSDAQRDPMAFIFSRLEKSGSPEGRRILAELRCGQAEIGQVLIFKVKDISKTTGGYKLKVLDWKQPHVEVEF